MTERSIYTKLSLEGTTFIKRCGLQCVVKFWKTLRLLDAYFWKCWEFWTTSKIALRIEYALLSEIRLFPEVYGINVEDKRRWPTCRNLKQALQGSLEIEANPG